MKRLRRLGFDGVFSGTKHQFVVRDGFRLTLPSNNVYSPAQVRMLLREAETMIGREIGLEEWNGLS